MFVAQQRLLVLVQLSPSNAQAARKNSYDRDLDVVTGFLINVVLEGATNLCYGLRQSLLQGNGLIAA